MKKDLDQTTLKQFLDYDPETGIFRQKLARRGVRVGTIAGTKLLIGYRQIAVNGSYYYAHRLAWLYVHGRWPKTLLDHANRVRDDNRICNLREASRYQSEINKGIRRNNKTGVTGVSFDRSRGKFSAFLSVNGKQIAVGRFSTLEDAAEAVQTKRVQSHKEFAPL